MNIFPLGQTVRLSVEVARKVHLRLDQKDHAHAVIVDRFDLIGPGYVRLSRELMGSDVWREKDLRKVNVPGEPEHSEILLRFRKSMLPSSKRHIQLGKETHSNLDFGFSPAQALVLDAFEIAVKDYHEPAGKGLRRIIRKKAVLAAYHEVIKAQLKDSLTPNELETVNACFGNTVL